MKLAACVIACLMGMATLSACGSQEGRRPHVVATSYPLFEAAAKIGGKKVHAINLLPTDLNAVLTPKKEDQLRTAELAVVLGGGAQPQLERVLSERKGPTLRVLGDSDVHMANGDFNIWLDPLRMARIAELVRDSLTGLLPGEDGVFTKNFKHYQSDVAGVDASYVETLASCKRRDLLVETEEFSILARRYGLRQQIIGPLSTLNINDEARQAIRRTGASTVFGASLPSLDGASKIRELYGVRVAVLDPIQTQTDQARRGGASWKAVMDLNLDALRDALDCERKEH